MRSMMMKCRITLPGKMQLYAWAYNKSATAGDFPAKVYYEMAKKSILEDAQKQAASLGKNIVMTFKNESGSNFQVYVKRRIKHE